MSSVTNSGSIDVNNHALALTRSSSDPHFQALQLTKTNSNATNTTEDDDPNWLLLGILGTGIVVFAAVPVLWLVTIVALDQYDKSTQDDGGTTATPPKSSGGSDISAISLTPALQKKKKKNGMIPIDE